MTHDAVELVTWLEHTLGLTDVRRLQQESSEQRAEPRANVSYALELERRTSG